MAIEELIVVFFYGKCQMECRQLECWTVESLDSGDPGMTRDGLRETPFKRGAKIRLRKSLVYIFFHVAVIKKIKNDYFF